MVRIQSEIPDEERDRIVWQARQEGMSLSAWLRAAARERFQRGRPRRPFRSQAEVEEFFAECDSLDVPATEPDWDEPLAAIKEARRYVR